MLIFNFVIWNVFQLKYSFFHLRLVVHNWVIKRTVDFSYDFRVMSMYRKGGFILMFICTCGAVRNYGRATVVSFLAKNSFAYCFYLRIHFNIKLN